jgi:DNA-binding transcriptional LysR family regulator
MLELRQLRYFEAVGTELNFSRAAERLHIAQPPLSRQIQQLEDTLGVVLIDRKARPMALTPAGRFFLEQTVQLLARLQETTEATQRIARGQRAWFGIGFVPSALYGLLPDLIRRFRALHHEVDVNLSELTTLQQVAALKAGRIDVGFGRLVLDDPEIAAVTVREEPVVAALPANHPLLAHDRLELQVLAREPLVLYPARPRPSYADQVLQMFRARGFAPQVAMEANELQTAIGVVAAGVGIALVPDSVRRLHRDDVSYRPIVEAGVVSPVIMSCRANDRSILLSRFRELVAGTMTGSPEEA